MSRSRDLANLAGDATGLETLTVSDITDLTASATELNYVDGVGSAIQTQINSKIGSSNPTVTLGSNTTFPAGTVLQVVQNESTETNTLTNTYTNLFEASITLKSGSSDIYGFFVFQYYVAESGGFGVKVYRNNSATVTASHTAVWTKNLASGGNPYTWHSGGTNAYRWDTASINPKDSLSGFSVGDTLYYGFFARSYDAGVVRLPDDEGEDGFISSTLMEVQK